MGGRFPFPGLPSGWYVVALSEELRPGRIVSRRYFDRELVLYRGGDGVARVADAFCPHMGAHLGRVGRLEGNVLRCAFHGFQYDGRGRCVATPYGGPPPAGARLSLWDVREQNGLVLAWYGSAGETWDWEVPALDDAGWNRIRWRRFDIASHPQETTENSVDFGHFTQIHGFADGSITRPVRVEGPLLSISYRAHRGVPAPGLPLWKVPVDYAVYVWGLGYSQVDVRVDPLRLDVRVWVLPAPRDDEHLDLVIGASTRRGLGPVSSLARRVAHGIVCQEVEEDLDVWNYKSFVERPPLAKGDGPVAAYRRYVRQFYPAAPAGRDEPPLDEEPGRD